MINSKTPRSNKLEALTPPDALGREAINLARSLEMENNRLRQELAQCCKQHEQASSEPWDLQQNLKSMVIK